jgi:polysaccharide export outer membrane protein
MKLNYFFLLSVGAGLIGSAAAQGLSKTNQSLNEAHTYILSPNDVVQIRVYQEEDLETKARVSKDGTIAFPLIGLVQVGGKTVQQAVALIRERLDRDYLVNPQVSLTIEEYAKRRFTVLGQVQKPGTFEIPSEESVTLLQAIAMAGGYGRLANRSSVTVTRVNGGRSVTFNLNPKQAAGESAIKEFEIAPEDTLTIPERLF